MSWTPLKEDYTDAVWSGLKKYSMIENSDDTVSFQDVTVYSNKENSFFGAYDANRINEAVNIIMAMLENGTDLYTNFQAYFNAQQTLFHNEADSKMTDFENYVANLETQGDALIDQIETDYSAEIEDFEDTQEAIFETWFDAVKGRMSGDVATNILELIDELTELCFNRYYGLCNKTTSITTNQQGNRVITENDTSESVTAVTTISIVSGNKQIVTVVTPTAGGYKYTKTVTITKSNGTTTITETYVKEVK